MDVKYDDNLTKNVILDDIIDVFPGKLKVRAGLFVTKYTVPIIYVPRKYSTINVYLEDDECAIGHSNCSACGNSIDISAKFCSVCGAKIKDKKIFKKKRSSNEEDSSLHIPHRREETRNDSESDSREIDSRNRESE